MKLKFDPNLDYQKEAIKAVTDLFEGQSSMTSYFSINGQMGFDYVKYDSDKNKYSRPKQVFGQGVANKLTLNKEDILINLRKVQTHNKLAPSESLDGLDFNIEMETGTGKTYVYLRTIFELNKLYDFKKFIIVVPSVAIKEGVYKNLQITRNHFKELYDNVLYDFFVYDSSKLEQVRNYSTNSNIQIMIINIDAFNKSFKDPSKETKANIIHRSQDKLNGYKPIDLIAETNPIVIIDEPQSVMGGKGEEAINSLNPLCTLRYSATHKEIQNLIYKLDAVDAYEKNLVKGIQVASFESLDYHNKAYLKLISTDNKKSPITAKIEVDANINGSIKRKTVTVKQGTDLSEAKITNRDIYQGYTVDEIYCEENNEYVSFTQKGDILRIGKPVGDIDDIEVKKAQIRKTIEEHLDKELELNKRFTKEELSKKGIKVLSLFFIDKVSNYRQYDEEGNPINGPYADIFEDQYKKIIQKPKYSTLYNDIDLTLSAEEVHNGYFSVDKKGRVKDTRETKKGKLRANKDDENTFNLIMKDKEKLLSFDSPLKFIFSHSALREGWDNPNVFQICTLNETKSNMKKRQEIGRGLRLCVNQFGDRIHDKSINTLTIMANESYEDFAKSLQTEMEKDSGIKFGIIDKKDFAHIVMENKKGEYKPIGEQGSLALFNHFKLKNYINGKGKIQDALKVAIDKDNIDIPEKYQSIYSDIVEVAKKHTKKVPVKDANKRREVKINKRVYLSEEFKEFWNKINHKTTYSVDFDTDELINNCSNALRKELNIHSPKLIYTKSGLSIDAGGVTVDENGKIPPSVVYTEEEEVALPDIITFLQNETFLTRKTIVQVLIQSDTINQFKKNPQEYMEESLKIIKRKLNEMLIDGIKYTELDDYYKQELFKKEELFGYLEKNMIKSEHSVYDYVVYDSTVEEEFARNLEKDESVELYVKLPGWFKINTPIGGYNPDWAVLFKDENDKHKLYFIVETKGTTDWYKLRGSEKDKIRCDIKHFKALGNQIKFEVANDYSKLKIDMG
ncbi:type III restriction endonuclease subunit R [Methanobrevibacter sp. 87.7]|uniref:type III restriction-modification system endonuclease n=1 Tax=Methanobrevibacter sp. 87.7 TaxID=387957 RepID=UPI000B5065AF|nr:DEAD/DEAH box helicase family protein [Methanobrevibacter sp. 87.7]OWT33795.1 type III restriction endonuclease subunit R [Methanobrevibacter sp. 87.7]